MTNSTLARNPMDILYLGTNSGTSLHRAKALERLGHRVRVVDLRAALPSNRWMSYWTVHTGALGLSSTLSNYVRRAVGTQRFDLLWVDGGDLVPPSLVRSLKQQVSFTVNYNVDDPYGTRDGAKWRLYLQSVPLYDLVVVMRACNVPEAGRAGARDVLRVYHSCDEVAHAPRTIREDELQRWKSDVAFIGTWMPERSPFFARLVQQGVPLSIWGDRWQKAPEWPVLRPFWRGPGLYKDDDYAKAIQSAAVCIGLLSKGNRDLVTTRSSEIPHLGSVLCAERTPEHLSLYEEGVEAVFWETPEECAAKCRQLLDDPAWRQQVARNGHARVLRDGPTNMAVLSQVIDRVTGAQAAPQKNAQEMSA